MMTVYEVQWCREGQWTRWGVYLYAPMAETVRVRLTQEGKTARVQTLTVD